MNILGNCPIKKVDKIFLLSLALVLVTLVAFFLSRPSNAVSFTLSPNKFTLKSGETVESTVILGGPLSLVKNVTVTDLKINYDKSKLKIVSAIPGSFFNHPWVVKSDTEAGLFTLATNPNTKGQVTLNASNQAEILKIEFQAISPVSNIKISFDEKTSSVYVSKMGIPKMTFNE